MRNDFKPEPTKRLRPVVKSFEAYLTHLFNIAKDCREKQDKHTLNDEALEALETFEEEVLHKSINDV